MWSWEKYIQCAEKKLSMWIEAGGLLLLHLTSLISEDYLKFHSDKFINLYHSLFKPIYAKSPQKQKL